MHGLLQNDPREEVIAWVLLMRNANREFLIGPSIDISASLDSNANLFTSYVSGLPT